MSTKVREDPVETIPDRDRTERIYNTRAGQVRFQELRRTEDRDWIGIIRLNGKMVGAVRRGAAPFRWTAEIAEDEGTITVGPYKGRSAVDRSVIFILRRGKRS